jgi:hypothetical protein
VRFPRNASLSLAAAALLLVVATPASAVAERAGGGERGRPTEKEILGALERVKADPDLTPEKTIHTLRWVSKTDPASDPGPSDWSLLRWIAQLIGWFAQSARVLVWTVVALLVGLLGVYLLSLVRARGAGARKTSQVSTPTHVQDLDIRPESLPENIGAAARKLWDAGDHRAALSLLYRGLLSRLVHVHNVPIRDSSTEGDCMRLTQTRLQGEKNGYVTRLIRVWQHAVYGDQQPQTAALHALCDEFSAALDVA